MVTPMHVSPIEPGVLNLSSNAGVLAALKNYSFLVLFLFLFFVMIYDVQDPDAIWTISFDNQLFLVSSSCPKR